LYTHARETDSNAHMTMGAGRGWQSPLGFWKRIEIKKKGNIPNIKTILKNSSIWRSVKNGLKLKC
jgi:hypothetical protein